ncbi:hypothetical protein [Streptomyces sp. NPDC008125]
MASRLRVLKRGVWVVLSTDPRQPALKFWDFADAIRRAQELARELSHGA